MASEHEPLTLTEEQQRTHEIVREHHDEERTKLKAEYVALRDEERTNDGPWRFFHKNGQLWSERSYREGKLWEVHNNLDAEGKPQDPGTVKEGEGVLKLYHENSKPSGQGEIKGGRFSGPWTYWFESGEQQAEGVYEADDKVGVWKYFRGGKLSFTEEFRPDNTIFVRNFQDDERSVWREGLYRKNDQGSWVKDGPFQHYDERGRLDYEEIHEMGTQVRRINNPEPVLKAFKRHEGSGAAKQLKAMNDAAMKAGGLLLDHVDVLLERGQIEVSQELAVELALTAYHDSCATVQRFTEPFGKEIVPLLEERAKQLMAAEYPDGRQAATLTLCLWRAEPDAVIDEKHDELIAKALDHFNRPSGMSPRAMAHLQELVSTLSEARREKLALGPYGVRWCYAGRCPTEPVIKRCIEVTLKWKRNEFTYGQERREAAIDAYRHFGAAAVPLVLETLAGPGKKAPQREILVRALAEAGSAEAAPALIEFCGEKIEAVSSAALQGLQELGDAALPALEEALKAKRKKLRTLAATALNELPLSDPVRELASRALKGEKNADVRKLLERVASREEETIPEGLQAVERLRATLSPEQREQILARIDEADAYCADKIAYAEVDKDPAALIVLMDQVQGYLTGVTSVQPPYMGSYNGIFYHGREHEAAPWLAARMLAAMPEKGSWNPKYVLQNLGELFEERLAEPLAWFVVQEQPDARKLHLKWLVEHYPEQGRPALLDALSDKSKACRELAVKGLSAIGPTVLPEVWPHLEGSAAEKGAAALVLRALPSADSVPHLEAAIKKEKNAKRKELLSSALGACRIAGAPTADDHLSTLDASLAERAPKKHPKLDPLPEVRWKDGTELSEGARFWLLGALADEGPGEQDPELRSIRAWLNDEDCAALCDRILEQHKASSKAKWVVYQQAVLGHDRHMDALGEGLGRAVYQQSAAFASHGVETLRRGGSPSAVRWLDHWAQRGSRKLKRDSREALRSLCEERGLSHDDLVDLATPTTDPGKHASTVARRLEAAMLVGRRWTPERFTAFVLDNPLVRGVSVGLVFAVHTDEADAGPRLCFISKEGELLDREQQPAPLSGAREVGLPHPIELDDQQLGEWTRLLDSLGLEPPFPQVTRAFTRSPQTALEALLQQATLPTKKMHGGLDRLGYERGEPEDAGMVYEAHRQVGSRWVITVSHDGFSVADGRNPNSNQSTINGFYLHIVDGHDNDNEPTPESLYSEAVNDLKEILGI